MTKKEAIHCLSNGHAEWTVTYAREICKAFGLELPKGLIQTWEGQADVNPSGNPKGLWLDEDKAGSGVNSLSLSIYIVDKLGLEVQSYIGRGFQAQANAEAVKEYCEGK